MGDDLARDVRDPNQTVLVAIVTAVDVAVSANEAAAQMSAFLSHPDLVALQPAAFVEDAAPFDAIAGKAQDLAADLVVVGTRGLSGLPRLLLGSVADQVLRTIECDVLAVPPPLSPG